MTKDLNTIFVIGFNYISYINNKFILENYLLFNQNSHNNKINNLADNNNLYIKGSLTFLLANYNKKILVYEIKNTGDENSKTQIKEKNSKSNDKEPTIYNTIDDNSGIVECNGNVICRMLFNSVTNNKYTINTLYITCIIIIITIVYQCNKNKNDKKRGKTFKEDNLNYNGNNSDKISEVLNQIKSMGKFESFADYKKRQRENDKNNNINHFEDDNDENFKNYLGDEDDDDEEDKGNSEEFLEKAYHNYVSDMMKKEKKNFENDNFDMSDDENNVNNYENNNIRNINRFEERKDQLSQEDSEDGRLNTD